MFISFRSLYAHLPYHKTVLQRLPLFCKSHTNLASSENLHRRTGICLPGGGGRGGEPFAPKNLTSCPNSTKQSKVTRVIRCTNNGLHMKWIFLFFFDIWIYIWVKNTLKLKRNSCLFHFEGRRYQWCGPCHCWHQSWDMPFRAAEVSFQSAQRTEWSLCWTRSSR